MGDSDDFIDGIDGSGYILNGSDDGVPMDYNEIQPGCNP
jgi:hypothetical protein